MRAIKQEVSKFEEKEDEYKKEIEDLYQEKEKESKRIARLFDEISAAEEKY